jgi:hypothetical protein
MSRLSVFFLFLQSDRQMRLAILSAFSHSSNDSSSRLAVTSWNSTRAFLPLSLLRVEDVPPLRELIATVLKRSRPRVPRRLVRLTTVSDVRIRRAMRAERSPSVRGRLSSSGAQFPRLRRGPSRFWLMTMRRQ